MNNETEETIVEADLDELLEELREEEKGYEEVKTPPKTMKRPQTFRHTIWKSWTRPPKKSSMALRFQKLAGILNAEVVASLTLPNGQRVEFTELPPWYDVIRYKLCGFKYEIYD